MTQNEWKLNWIKTLIDRGFSPSTARDIYSALYGRSGGNLEKDPTQEARELMGTTSSRSQDDTAGGYSVS